MHLTTVLISACEKKPRMQNQKFLEKVMFEQNLE